MPRAPVPYLPGGYYHIFNRGAHGKKLFRTPDNYEFVLRKLKHYLDEYQTAVIAYCLMPNHYHFIIRQDGDTPASRVIQHTFNSYTKAYNIRFEHQGTLFQSQFSSKHITDDRYLLQCCRYVHANPVKARLCRSPADWVFSNYLEWVGMRNGTLVDKAFIQRSFPKSEDYIGFVREYLEQPPDSQISFLG